MIIFGTRGVTFGGHAGEFNCPGCGWVSRPYKHRTVRRFFTLYFIPVIPLDKLGEFIECEECKGQYKPEILTFDPRAEAEKQRVAFFEHIARLGVLAARLDGPPTDARLDALRHVWQQLTERVPDPAVLNRELTQAGQSQCDLNSYARQHLADANDRGKEMAVRAVLAVALADGELSATAETEIADLVRGLQMSTAHYRGILAEVEEQRQGDYLSLGEDEEHG